MRHAHQAIAAAADRFHLFLAWQRLAFRPGDETFSLVERGDTGRLHGDITAVATGEVGGDVTVQSRFGSNLLQADGTRQTNGTLAVGARGGGGLDGRSIHRRDVDAAGRDRRAACFYHGARIHVYIADGRRECGRRVVHRKGLGSKLHRGIRISLHRELTAGFDRCT